jgi:hypothetical protein
MIKEPYFNWTKSAKKFLDKGWRNWNKVKIAGRKIFPIGLGRRS